MLRTVSTVRRRAAVVVQDAVGHFTASGAWQQQAAADSLG